MNLDKQSLIAELRKTLEDVESQIDVIKRHADDTPDWENSNPVNEFVPSISPMELRLPDGSWPMIPLLSAKAECLNAIAKLVTA